MGAILPEIVSFWGTCDEQCRVLISVGRTPQTFEGVSLGW